MSRYRKWVLTLGIVAATPGLAAAGPFSFGQSKDDGDARSASESPKLKNQRMAEDIAVALKKAAFHGYEIDIEYKDGLATLRGKVSDPRQKARASQIVSAVAGVHRVENKIVVVSDSKGGIRQVAGYDYAPGGYVPPAAPARRDAMVSNQEKAIQIGRALQGAGLSGYDVEVMYQDGQALLRGTIGNPEQRAAASRVAGAVPGVYSVTNQLRVEGQAPPRYAQAAYQPVPPQGPPGTGPEGAAPPSPQGVNPPMPAGGPPGGVPMPATGPSPRGPVYDNPNIPEYAWPAYAQYPNYAAVTYPSQYSASAWPYIGPFYPYPQVPLNWRKVSLEWEDGNWNLKFDSRTDRWWWFLNPKNW